MIKKHLVILLSSLFFLPAFYTYADPLTYSPQNVSKYLDNRIVKSDKRFPTFLMTLKLLNLVKAKVLVETGTSRHGDRNFWGDGGSTILFGDWATDNQAMLYTVDLSSNAIEASRSATKSFSENIQYHCCDSIKFLEQFGKPIDFLYLDSYDFDERNPLPSQVHHLQEITAAYPFLHKKSIVVIDDCDLPQGGKGKLIIEFLLAKGWVIFSKGYQVIMVREDFEF